MLSSKYWRACDSRPARLLTVRIRETNVLDICDYSQVTPSAARTARFAFLSIASPAEASDSCSAASRKAITFVAPLAKPDTHPRAS